MTAWDRILQQASIDPSTLIVTANNRLTRFLTEYWQKNTVNPHKVTIYPAIMPWSKWINTLATQSYYLGKTSRMLATERQIAFLWQEALNQQAIRMHPIIIDPLQNAYTNLKHWKLSFSLLKQGDHPDHVFFLQVANDFQSLCHTYHLQTEAEYLQDFTHVNSLEVAKHIFLVGFSEITPLQQAFIAHLVAMGITIEWITLRNPVRKECYFIYPDPDQELAAMAQWSFTTGDDENPLPILCIVPDLQERREQVIYHMSAMQPHYPTKRSYNIAGGKPLSDYPMIQILLNTLKLHVHSLSTIHFCYWLSSPYLIGADNELDKRRLIADQVKQTMYQPIDYALFQTIIEQSDCSFLKTCIQLPWDRTESSTISDYLGRFDLLINTYCAMKQRDVSHLEYQLLKKWDEVVTQCQELAVFNQRCKPIVALEWLEKLCQQTLFQVESEDNRIQVLGLLEAVGMPAQTAWITSLSDTVLPMPARANPFLPYLLQQKYQLPHATADKQLAYAKQLRTLWQQTYSTIHYSMAQDISLHTRPSRLLNDLPQDKEQFDYIAYYMSHQPVVRYLRDDTYGLPFKGDQVSGGASVLKTQSACPFKAYIRYRLNTKGLHIPHLGYNALEKGNIVHTLLEKFWRVYKNKEQLCTLSTPVIEKTLEQLYKTMDKQVFKQPTIIQKLEQRRSVNLATTWLNYEKMRPAFSIEAVEATCHYTINGIKFELRMDRIDQLNDESKLVIDYKISSQRFSAHQWQPPRMKEPQMPMYALALGDDCRAITFATIHLKHQQFNGISDTKTAIDGIDAVDWSNHMDQWESDIHDLVQAFQSGYSAIDPKSPTTCRHCDYKAICRIKPG